jgi:hypothetical protein
MRSKTLILLGVAAVIAIGAAIAVETTRKSDESVGMQPTLLFPGLGAKVGAITAITVAGAKEKLTIVKSNEADSPSGWAVKEKADYPAKADAVKAAIAGLVDSKAVEPRTDQPDLYGKIGVEDIDKPDSKAVRLAVADAGGKELAALLLGTTKSYESGSHPAQVYVRKPGEARSWLAEGRLEIKTDPMTWIDREVTKISRDRIMAVEIDQPGGDKVLQSRTDPKQEDWTVTGLPAGAKPKVTDLNGTASALEFLTCENVTKASDVAFDKPVVATFRSFDGLVVTVKSVKKDGKPWIQLAATYDGAQAAKNTPTKPAAPAGDKAAADAASGASSKPADDVAKEAAEIQRKFGPWAYQLPDYQAGNFTHTPAELVMTEKKDN